jgi:chromosomal replication initiator protein
LNHQLVIEELKKSLPTEEFEQNIKQLVFDQDDSSENTKIFRVKNIFLAKWIQTKYSEIIKNAYYKLFEQNVKIIIEQHSQKKVIPKIEKTESPKEQEKKTPLDIKQTPLNRLYTFENFIIGNSNQFAYTACKAVSEQIGILYNPLFLYGSVGLGKTHLLQSVGNENILKNNIVIYTTIEQFTNDFTYHLRNKKMDNFREKYRKCDVLLIDDVQFLSNKIQTQEEFFHTFNELHNLKKQIILTSDKHPKYIEGLEERLISRFEWGLIADIKPPTLETKIKIIQQKCKMDNVKIDLKIIQYIATRLNNNIREIEGIIIRLNASATLLNQKITLEFTKELLEQQTKTKKKDVTLQDIAVATAKEFNLKLSDIKSKKKNRIIVKARRVIIYLSRILTDESMPTVAKFFELKDHSSISHSIKKIEEEIDSNESFYLVIEELKNRLSYE